MLNLFVNYDCNLACDYCFARSLGAEHPLRLDEQHFERLCNWLESSKVPFLGILGGEPTLHPQLPQMLERLKAAGVATALFTNALYVDEALSWVFAAATANIVVNCNDPAHYSERQVETRRRNLLALKEAGARVSFSRNFSPGNLAYEYLYDYCAEFDVGTIRYDVSRPASGAENSFYQLGESHELASMLIDFARGCEARGILTGLDCCLPACMFEPGDLQWLREHTLRATTTCRPSLDIHTDLQASYCLPLHGVMHPDVTATAGEWELMSFMADAARNLRDTRPKACAGCEKFGRECQGGCLALRGVA
jgi:MoaA/NifB/PqqE/SkfB family radical SAM enzyme